MANIIGDATSQDTIHANAGHGIRIESSSDARIGDADFANSNVIRDNGGAGVFVVSGEGNTIRRNVIEGNGGLGIDLAPIGVNPNDSADVDTGPNMGENYPVIDSVSRTNIQTTIYGHVPSEPLAIHIVEIFVSDTCDSSGYGEGLESVWTTTASTGSGAVASFATTFGRVLDAGEVFTLTATDNDGNTSEFSACWPRKTLEIVDVDSVPISNHSFELFRIERDPPTYTHTLVDTIVTDDSGWVSLEGYLALGDLDDLSMFKLHKLLQSQPSAKHPTLMSTAYSVHLDNMKFDSLGAAEFGALDSSVVQQVVMDHTTIKFNLVVSIEWDARLAYINSMEQGFRLMSNYFYDVSDGQMCLDTVVILDDRWKWDFADFQIHASNIVWPHVKGLGGFFLPAGPGGRPVLMPRKWFGSAEQSRNLSASEDPLDLTTSREYRTRLHEFGHFALILKDEYKFKDGQSRCGAHPQFTNPFGMMDYQYVSAGPRSSEMSTASSYSDPSCRNNRHWDLFGKSCWDVIDSIWQRTYTGIEAPIFQPSERGLASGLDYLVGPNDSISSLDYDVGALMTFPEIHSAPSAFTVRIRVFDDVGALAVNVNTGMLDTSTVSTEAPFTDQGKTSDSGRAIILGFTNKDMLTASGRAVVEGAGLAAVSAPSASWVYGTAGGLAVQGDSLVMNLQKVQGNLPFIMNSQLGNADAALKITTTQSLASNPTVDHEPVGSPYTSYVSAPVADGYEATVGDSLPATGQFRIWAVDDSGSTFFVPAPYTVTPVPLPTGVETRGPEGAAEYAADSLLSTPARVMLMSTTYPVIRTGLDPLARQLGDANSLSLEPVQSLAGEHVLTLRYLDSDLGADTSVSGMEESARIFHWNDGSSQWTLVGGSVDTGFNEVTASITETGVYAVFTTLVPTDVGDDGYGTIIPERFELGFNFPNPFNPSTTFEYSLPEPTHVRIEVFNILGRHVVTLQDGHMPAGIHTVTWNGNDRSGQSVATGVYFYRIDTGEHQAVRRMLLLK